MILDIPKQVLALLIIQVALLALMIYDSKDFKTNRFFYISIESNWVAEDVGFEGWHPALLPIHAINVIIASMQLSETKQDKIQMLLIRLRTVAVAVLIHYLCRALNSFSQANFSWVAGCSMGVILFMAASKTRNAVAYSIIVALFVSSAIAFTMYPDGFVDYVGAFWIIVALGIFIQAAIEHRQKQKTWKEWLAIVFSAACVASCACQYPKRKYLLFQCAFAISILLYMIVSDGSSTASETKKQSTRETNSRWFLDETKKV